MPIYEYACEQCGTVTEVLRRMAEADSPIACGKCGSKKTARAKSVVAVGGGKDASLPIGGGGGHVHSGGCCGCGKMPGSCGIG